MIDKFINLIKSGFTSNPAYSVLDRVYSLGDKSFLGYVIVKNYSIFWINGYDRIAMCCDKDELDKTIKRLKIKL